MFQLNDKRIFTVVEWPKIQKLFYNKTCFGSVRKMWALNQMALSTFDYKHLPPLFYLLHFVAFFPETHIAFFRHFERKKT